MRLKPAGKLIILLVFIGLAFIGYNLWGSKLAPKAPDKPTNQPKVGEVPNLNPETGGSGSSVVNIPVMGGDPGCAEKTEVRLLHWALDCWPSGPPRSRSCARGSRHMQAPRSELRRDRPRRPATSKIRGFRRGRRK